MADPICRWRNPYVSTVLELIDVLPKYEQSEASARSYINQSYEGDFFRTPYQLACQLGLYHFTEGYYFPKFTYIPNEDEIKKYLESWIVNYTVPNPYTRSIPETIQPFSIHEKICQKLSANLEPIPWIDALDDIFLGLPLGNLDILRNTLNEYSPVVKIERSISGDYLIDTKNGKSYNDLHAYLNVEISLDRNDKEYFFDLFKLPHETEGVFNNLTVEATDEEKDILNELENIDLSQTEKYQIAKARIGQGKFRRLLIEEGAFCPFTQVDDFRLLVASHIKPWSVSSNSERLNPKNGLLLTPTYDKLFDKGFISFTNDKKLMISNELTSSNISRLGLTFDKVVSNINIEGREGYFAYHRDNVFKNNF